MKEEIGQSTVITENFDTPLSVSKRSSHKINRCTEDSKYLIDTYKAFPTRVKYTFFLIACGTFIKLDHMLTSKISQLI